ncbi:MAG: hypothetical protein GC179_12405 [Anaerolineaceae bacterium]|nr:hypothetical protein [Anaerolineaceae bacterium]
MSDKNLIEIRILGENATPDKISSRDVGELISSIEIMLAAIVARDNRALGIDESQITVGLAAIEHHSYDLIFQSQFEQEVIVAANQVATSINTGNYSKIPSKSIEAVKTLRKIARKYSTDIEFWQKNGKNTQLATVNTNTKIDAEIPTSSGKTTLYGTVISVGGVEPPRASIRLSTGNIQVCHITRGQDLQIARQLGQRLYSEVGVYGTARWDLRDMSLDHFLIERVTEYSKKPVDQALESIYDIVGNYYSNVDIEQLITEIRGTDEEEN